MGKETGFKTIAQNQNLKLTWRRSRTAALAFHEDDLATDAMASSEAGMMSRGRMDCARQASAMVQSRARWGSNSFDSLMQSIGRTLKYSARAPLNARERSPVRNLQTKENKIYDLKKLLTKSVYRTSFHTQTATSGFSDSFD